jgi:WS/DGAT/MGAT family acyltransferase
MDQLTGVDSFILSEERGHNYVHVATLALYDQSTAPGGKVRFKEILETIRARLGVSKVFRRLLATVPFGLDRPYWVDVKDLDLEFHVRHIALPQPGDWRQLMIQVARLHSRPLDRSRPLWEMYVIEGLNHVPGVPAGAFAIFTKMHHAAVDGATAIEIVRCLHDGQSSGRADAATGEDGGDAERVAQAIGHGVGRVGQTTRFSLQVALKIAGIVLDQVAQRLNPAVHEGGHAHAMPSFPRAPLTRFNHPISANRAVEAVGLPLTGVKRIRALAEGATINDVFLAVCGGALRRYLLSKDDLPARSLAALMPISLRGDASPDPNRPGNQVGGVPVPLRTDIEDPVEQLRAIRQEAQRAKEQAELVGPDLPTTVVEALPHFVASAFLRSIMMPQLNTAVSNVRGPSQAIYFAGARLVQLYPVSMPADYAGLNHTAISYDGTLWISAVACRNMLPDPAFYAECLRASYEVLLQRADEAATRATPPAVQPSAPGKVTQPRTMRKAKVSAVKRAPRIRQAAALAAGSTPRPARRLSSHR